MQNFLIFWWIRNSSPLLFSSTLDLWLSLLIITWQISLIIDLSCLLFEHRLSFMVLLSMKIISIGYFTFERRLSMTFLFVSIIGFWLSSLWVPTFSLVTFLSIKIIDHRLSFLWVLALLRPPPSIFSHSHVIKISHSNRHVSLCQILSIFVI